MSTALPAREQLRWLPAPNTELPFRPCLFKCVKVGSQLGGRIPMLDTDWWIRWLWQWWFVLGSSLVSRLRWILPSESPLNGTAKVTDIVVEGEEQSIHVLLHGREAHLHLHLMDGLLVDTPLSVEQDALWDCTMCSTNHPRSGNNSSSALTLTLLCHLLDAQVAVDGTDMQGDLLHCVDSTVDIPQSAR